MIVCGRFDVFHRKPLHDYIARIAASVALLITSCLGQWLHHLEHHSVDQHCSGPGDSPHLSHSHKHACGHVHHRSHVADGREAEHDPQSPAAPHDHRSCSICCVIAQVATSPVVNSAPAATEPFFEQRLVESEAAAPAAHCTPIARGPPSVGAGPMAVDFT